LLAEWVEFQLRYRATPWSLHLKTAPSRADITRFEFVTGFWEHVQALKRQLGVQRARVLLEVGDLNATNLRGADACVATSLGTGFSRPIAAAAPLRMPVVAPRHTGFVDLLPPDCRYTYPTRRAIIRLIGCRVRAADAVSAWQVPEPGAVAESLRVLAHDFDCGTVHVPRSTTTSTAALVEQELVRLQARYVMRVEPIMPLRQPA
jgi:hypothetical protein